MHGRARGPVGRGAGRLAAAQLGDRGEAGHVAVAEPGGASRPAAARSAAARSAAAAGLGEPLVHEERLRPAVGDQVSDLGRGEVPVDRRQVPAAPAARPGSTSKAADELGSSAAMPSPGRRPAACSPLVSWLTRPSRSPALTSVPSGSTTAIQLGSCSARRQKPTLPPGLVAPSRARRRHPGKIVKRRSSRRRTPARAAAPTATASAIPRTSARRARHSPISGPRSWIQVIIRCDLSASATAARTLRGVCARRAGRAARAGSCPWRVSRSVRWSQHHVHRDAGDRVDPVGGGRGQVLRQRDVALRCGSPTSWAGSVCWPTLTRVIVLDELVDGDPVDGGRARELGTAPAAQGHVEHLVGPVRGAEREPEAQAGLPHLGAGPDDAPQQFTSGRSAGRRPTTRAGVLDQRSGGSRRPAR